MTRRIFSSSKSLLIRVQIFITKNTFYFCSIYIKNCCNNHEILVLYFQINISPFIGHETQSNDSSLTIHFYLQIFLCNKGIAHFRSLWMVMVSSTGFASIFPNTDDESQCFNDKSTAIYFTCRAPNLLECFPSSKSVLRSHASKTLRIINHLCFCHAIVNE